MGNFITLNLPSITFNFKALITLTANGVSINCYKADFCLTRIQHVILYLLIL